MRKRRGNCLFYGMPCVGMLALGGGCYVERSSAPIYLDSGNTSGKDAGAMSDASSTASPDATTKADLGGTAKGTGGAAADASTGDVVLDGARATDASPEGEVTDPDTDVALVRLNVDGTLDTTFGENGVARVDFGAGSGTIRDTLWNVSLDDLGRFVVFGARKGAGTRIDLDRVVVRLTSSGAVDTTFATAGTFTSAFTNLNLSDQSRGGIVQPDGKIVSVGFTPAPTGVGTQTSNRLVLFRLWGGALDQTFGVSGLATLAPFMPTDPINTQWGTFEPAAVARQKAGGYVTAGFGRAASSGEVNLVTLRHTADGLMDTTWGTSGVQQLDIAKQNDRGRAMVVLPDDRIVVVGGGSPRANVLHPLVTVLQASGALDSTFNAVAAGSTGVVGGGYKLYDFGNPNEEFQSVALSPDGRWLAAVGFSTATGAPADSVLALVPLDATAGPEFARAVPTSLVAEDRFLAVTFDDKNRAYAVGFVTKDGDTQMVVARFQTTGALDPTFGPAGGVVIINVADGGGTLETARSVVVQDDGKIVIAGDVEH